MLNGLISQLVSRTTLRPVNVAMTRSECECDGRVNEAQWRYITEPERFNIVVCSRRAGKSTGALKRAFRVLTTKHCARVCYITLIRRNCRKYFYRPLIELLRSRGAVFRTNEQDLTIELASGGFAQASSCMEVGDIATVLGDKWDLVLIDEAQDMRDEVIQELVDRAILPSLVDRRGSLDLLGTPPTGGQVGYFYDVFAENKFARHRWTLYDNPWIPSHEIDELIAVRGLTKEHPIYRREFLGEFVVDPEALVFEYDAARNSYSSADFPESDTWRYSLGLDLGFQDRDAIVVLGWRRDDPDRRLYERWSWQQNHQDFDKLSEVFQSAYRRWRPISVIGDTGGHGAVKVLKSLEARLGGIQIGTKPSSLSDSIGLVNDELRTGRLRVSVDGPIADDFKLVVWKAGKHGQEVSEVYHSDILAALRYALHGAQHYRAKAPVEETTDQRRMRAMQQRREDLVRLYR